MRELSCHEISIVAGAAPIKLSDDIKINASDLLYGSALVAFACATFFVTLPVMMVYKYFQSE